MKNFIFGMAKFNSIDYGIGKTKNITNLKDGYKLLNYIYFEKKIKKFELSKRYDNSINTLSSFIKNNNCKTKVFYKIDELKNNKNNFDKILYDINVKQTPSQEIDIPNCLLVNFNFDLIKIFIPLALLIIFVILPLLKIIPLNIY